MSNDFMYYSKVTKKPYESLEALTEAEEAVKKAEEERLAKEKEKEAKAAEINADIEAFKEMAKVIEGKIAEYNKEYGTLRLTSTCARPSLFPFFKLF